MQEAAETEKRPVGRQPGTRQYVEGIEQAREERYERIRELVLEHRRFDILARHVLGYDPKSFHREMMDFQDENREGMVLAWRGAGKTTYCTIVRAIGEILCDPNIRILFASDAAEQAKTYLREVKQHFATNETLREIFGDYVTGSMKWAENEITVNRRSSYAKEATITCVGIGTVLPGRHFDLALCPDLVTQDNSETEGQRQKVFDYFYKTLMPCVQMPHGRMYLEGTRWDDDDLYGWLQKEDFKECTLVLPVLDENDQSVWEEMFPTDRLLRIRKANLHAFMLQYMLEAIGGTGRIFTQEHFTYYDDLPPDVFLWQGVDPAISQKDTAASFAHVTIAMHKATRKPYLIDFCETRMPFPNQLRFIATKWDEHPGVMRAVVESNAFQLAVKQQMAVDYPHVRILASWTQKDKTARANQLSAIVGEQGIHIKRSHHKFLQRLCALPKSGKWDLFDAFYFAVMQGLRGARRSRRAPVGLI